MESVKCNFYVKRQARDYDFKYKYSRNFKTMDHFRSHMKMLHDWNITIYERDGEFIIKMED